MKSKHILLLAGIALFAACDKAIIEEPVISQPEDNLGDIITILDVDIEGHFIVTLN